MNTLIAKLEAATGPSRELDGAIAIALGHEISDAFEGQQPRPALTGLIMSVPGETYKIPVPHWTRFIDETLMLVPEGFVWRLQTDYGGLNRAAIAHYDGPFYNETQSDAATPALALCIAALKARKDSKP